MTLVVKVREFVEMAAKQTGYEISWKGEGVAEKGMDKKAGKTIVEINPQYFRPSEVDLLLGDAGKATKVLKWQPTISFSSLVKMMVEADKEYVLKRKYEPSFQKR